jgi:hypothetical protein
MNSGSETSFSDLETEKVNLEKDLKEINDQIFQLDGNEEYIGLIYELNDRKFSLENDIEVVTLYLKAGYTEYTYDDFIAQAIGMLPVIRFDIRALEEVPSDLRDAQWTEASSLFQDSADLIYTLTETKDFKTFIDMKKQYMEFNTMSYMTDNDKQIASESLDLWY